MIDYTQSSKIFKCLSEPMRLKILNMISCEEMCACDLLKKLSIAQSTLSHHMKVLAKAGLIVCRKDATWMYYSINRENIEALLKTINNITTFKQECICHESEDKTTNKC